jgi:hypothetical protein
MKEAAKAESSDEEEQDSEPEQLESAKRRKTNGQQAVVGSFGGLE